MKTVHLSAEEISLLRRHLQTLPEVSNFRSHPELSARIASYGILREVGTVNDESARFIYDADSGEPIRREGLKAEFVEWKNLFGVRIFSSDSKRLELRTKGFYNVVHPSLSRNLDGTFHSLVIFPEIIRRIVEAEGVDLVLVKTWGMNSIFGGFNPNQGYYQTNFWELQNNDALRFADLTRHGQIAFMGTHDLIAHISGVDRAHIAGLKQTAERVYQSLKIYFGSTGKPSIAALILPYTVGVVLDDLAQPPSYGSAGHLLMLSELLKELERKHVPADLRVVLTTFPPSFEKIIQLAREKDVAREKIQQTVAAMTQEILNASLKLGA